MNALRARTSPIERRPRLLPRFGLRSLFVVALLFCLLFGWIGRNAYRMRQEDAAIEALKQAEAAINMQHESDRGDLTTYLIDGDEPPTPPTPGMFSRMIGWSSRLPIRAVRLHGFSDEQAQLVPALDALEKLPEIERLILYGEAFDDRAMPAVAKLSNLKELVVEQTRVTSDGLASLAPHVRLRRILVRAHDPNLLDGFAGFAQFAELERAEFSGTNARREDVAEIASLPRLEHLELWNLRSKQGGGVAISRKSEAIYMPLAQAKGLKTLLTGSIGMSDDEVAALADLPFLERLFIDGITDAGLAELADLPNLKMLRVTSPVTREAARRFSADHPDCSVFYWVPFDESWMRPSHLSPTADPNAERSEYFLAGESVAR